MNCIKQVITLTICIVFYSLGTSQTLDTLTFYPNPVSDTLFMEFETNQVDTATFEFYSQNGSKFLSVFKDSTLNQGQHNLFIIVRNWSYGLYIGEIKFNSGDSVSFIIYKSPTTSIKYINSKDYSIIFPSPSNGKFHSSLNNAKHLIVINIAGEIVYESDIDLSDIDLTFLPNGIYLIQIRDNTNTVYRQKVIITH